jgi:hypothetical protein
VINVKIMTAFLNFKLPLSDVSSLAQTPSPFACFGVCAFA